MKAAWQPSTGFRVSAVAVRIEGPVDRAFAEHPRPGEQVGVRDDETQHVLSARASGPATDLAGFALVACYWGALLGWFVEVHGEGDVGLVLGRRGLVGIGEHRPAEPQRCGVVGMDEP